MSTDFEIQELQSDDLQAQEEWLDMLAASFAVKGTPRQYFAEHLQNDPNRHGIFVATIKKAPKRKIVSSTRVFSRKLLLHHSLGDDGDAKSKEGSQQSQEGSQQSHCTITPINVFGIGEVATLSKYRGLGLASKCLTASLAYIESKCSKDSNALMKLAILHCAPKYVSFYQKRGFIHTLKSSHIKINLHHAIKNYYCSDPGPGKKKPKQLSSFLLNNHYFTTDEDDTNSKLLTTKEATKTTGTTSRSDCDNVIPSDSSFTSFCRTPPSLLMQAILQLDCNFDASLVWDMSQLQAWVINEIKKRKTVVWYIRDTTEAKNNTFTKGGSATEETTPNDIIAVFSFQELVVAHHDKKKNKEGSSVKSLREDAGSQQGDTNDHDKKKNKEGSSVKSLRKDAGSQQGDTNDSNVNNNGCMSLQREFLLAYLAVDKAHYSSLGLEKGRENIFLDYLYESIRLAYYPTMDNRHHHGKPNDYEQISIVGDQQRERNVRKHVDHTSSFTIYKYEDDRDTLVALRVYRTLRYLQKHLKQLNNRLGQTDNTDKHMNFFTDFTIKLDLMTRNLLETTNKYFSSTQKITNGAFLSTKTAPFSLNDAYPTISLLIKCLQCVFQTVKDVNELVNPISKRFTNKDGTSRELDSQCTKIYDIIHDIVNSSAFIGQEWHDHSSKEDIEQSEKEESHSEKKLSHSEKDESQAGIELQETIHFIQKYLAANIPRFEERPIASEVGATTDMKISSTDTVQSIVAEAKHAAEEKEQKLIQEKRKKDKRKFKLSKRVQRWKRIFQQLATICDFFDFSVSEHSLAEGSSETSDTQKKKGDVEKQFYLDNDTESSSQLGDCMKAIVDERLPKQRLLEDRRSCFKELERIVRQRFGKNVKLFPYGSTTSLFATSKSDLDVCLTVNK
eukprot:g2237.t1